MLGRFGDSQEQPQQLLDWHQIGAMTLSLVTLAAGLLLQYLSHASPFLYNSFYLVGILLLGGPIVINAIRGVLAGHTNVDELIALALIASCAGGYFLEADIVAILMVAGSMFEQRASLKARRAIEQLLRLTPDEATLLHDDGREQIIPADQLKPHQRILVRPGQRIPADGTIESGHASIDQSAVTGESVPVYRQPGESAFAGTLALDGSLTLRVTRTGPDSTVGQIIKIVQDAEHYQAPVTRIIDQWARYYTPLILIIATATLLTVWLLHRAHPAPFTAAWKAAVAVLIVGCPCTLVLATPTAIIAAMGRAARLGVLIKNGAVLEQASRVNTLIFDKTGTLTSGRHEVVSVVPADDIAGLQTVQRLCPALEHSILKFHREQSARQWEGEAPAEPLCSLSLRERAGVRASSDSNSALSPHLPTPPSPTSPQSTLLSLAAAVEYHSNHPFARAIRAYAESHHFKIDPAQDIKETPGLGVQGRVNGALVRVGRPEFIARSIHNACEVPGTLIRPISRYSVIAVESAGRYAGLILLRDTLRPAAEAVVDELRSSGLQHLAVLSGDHQGAVKLVAEQLKLDHAYSGLLPADKAAQIKSLRDQGRVVGFIGDGINDAPALATADIGIAMGGSGADIALQTAHVVLLNDRIELLAILFSLARRTRRTIHMNLTFGLVLNIAALALASATVLSPILGALVHNLGSAIIVGNSAALALFNWNYVKTSSTPADTTPPPPPHSPPR